MTAPLDRFRLFGLRELRTHRGRVAASITVVAVSAAFLVAVLGISGSVTGSLQRLTSGIAGNATLEVGGIAESGFPQTITREVAAVNGVRAAVPLLRMQVAAPGGDAMLLGVDASGSALENDLKDALQQQIPALLRVQNGVLIGPGLGLAEGESFDLGATRVTVAAVLTGDAVTRLNGGHLIVAPLPLAQRGTGREGRIDSILIVEQPDSDPMVLRQAVTAAVAGRAVVADPAAQSSQGGGGLKILQGITVMGASVAFVVAAFLIYTAMSMAITQRRPVISMLRAIGGRSTVIIRDLLAEAALLGLIGGIIGAALGAVLGRLAIGQLPAPIMQSVEARTEYIVPLTGIAIAIAAAMLTSVAAAAIAARQVYKVSPIEALAPVGVSAADAVRPALRVAAAVAGIALLVITVAVPSDVFGKLAALKLAFAFGAGITLCFAFAGPIVHLVAAAARIFGAPGALAGATVERAPRRVWATAMTVFIAVGMTVEITGSNSNTVASAKALFDPLSEPTAWVSATPSDEYPVGPVLPADLSERLTAVPGVARATESQLAYAAVGGSKVLLMGVAEGSDQPLLRKLDDRDRAAVLAGQGVVLSRDLGATLDVKAGDELTLQTPKGLRHTKVLRLESYFSVLTGTVLMDVRQLRDWFDRPGSTLLQVDSNPGANSGQVLAAIRAATPAQVHVYSGAAFVEGIYSSLQQATAMANMIWIIVVLIASVALLNTLTLSVIERRRELGVLRALGSNRRFILRVILAEAAGIGLVGGTIGLAFGLANQYLYSLISTDFMGFEVQYRPSPVALAFALAALLLSLAGSLPPALRAAHLNIIEAIETE